MAMKKKEDTKMKEYQRCLAIETQEGVNFGQEGEGVVGPKNAGQDKD